MHPKQMTPAWVIINAVLVGVLAWFGIFVLRLLPYFEPAIVDELCGLWHLASHCSVHRWHTYDQSWYGIALDAFHPVIVLGAAACSAIRDFQKLLKGQ